MYCPHCGEQHSDDAKFCPVTGKPVEPKLPPSFTESPTMSTGLPEMPAEPEEPPMVDQTLAYNETPTMMAGIPAMPPV